VPDQVPANRNINRGNFFQRFLNLVLTDVVQSGFVRCPRGVRSMRLRDRHDGDLLPMPAPGRRRCDPALHLGDTLGQPRKRHNFET
jgi:hypothetical protein